MAVRHADAATPPGLEASKNLRPALGRRPDHYDKPAVRKIVRGAAAQGYRWSSLILGIVESPAFRIRAAGPRIEGPVGVRSERHG